MSRQRRRRHGQRPEVRARRTDRPPAILQPAGPQDQRRHHRAKARILRYRPPPRKPATTEQTIPLAEYCRRRHRPRRRVPPGRPPHPAAHRPLLQRQPRLRPALAQRLRIAQVQPGQAAAACADSSGGSSSSARSPRSSRNWRVVPNSAGRPGASRWPITSIQPRSSSALTIWDDTVTPRMSSISPRVTGWRQATIASVSMTAREYFRRLRDSAAPGSAAFQDGSESASPWPAAPVPGRRRPNWPARFPTARARRCCRILIVAEQLAHVGQLHRLHGAQKCGFQDAYCLAIVHRHSYSKGPTCVGWKIRLIFFSQTRVEQSGSSSGLITRRS